MLFFAELLAEVGALGTLAPADYPGLYRTLAQPRTVRQTRNVHPRAFIWGPLEARLQSADRIILGGLNEKTWPQAIQSDPWLSRPMRTALDMSPPERRIGQSAHDFVQLAGGSDVILTRSIKADGAQTVAFEPGDVFLCYSDGATDEQDPDGEFFGRERLVEVVRAASEDPPDVLVQRIQDEIDAHLAGAHQEDDLTLVVLKRCA